MTDNALMTISQEELDAFAAEMGASAEDLSGGGGSFLPAFKVWSEDDDEAEDAPRLKGKLYLTGQEENVFADIKTVRFRPLTHTFQWRKWDKENQVVSNKTVLIYSFKEEAQDEKGTVRCGKPPSKELKDNKALQELYKDITTFRIIQGYVSYTGKTKEGKTVEVKDVLASINAKGASFNQFDEEYIKLLPAKSNLWDFETGITLSKEKNVSVTYWVMHYVPDFATKKAVTIQVFNDMKELKSRIEATNKAIRKKYFDAVNSRSSTDAGMDAINSVVSGRPGKPGLDDFDSLNDDDIPF